MRDPWLLTLQIPVAHSLGPLTGLPAWDTSFWRKLWYPVLPPRLPTNRLFLFTTLLPGEQRLLIPTCDLRGPVSQAWRKLKPQPATWHRNVQLVPSWGSCDRDPAINIRGASDQDRIWAPGEEGKEALCGYFVIKARPQVCVERGRRGGSQVNPHTS